MQARLPRDCRSATRPRIGATEWRGAQSMPRRYLGCPGSVGSDDLGENGGVWRMGLTRRFFGSEAQMRETRARKRYGSYAPTITVLAQFVAFDRTRALLISQLVEPGHVARARSATSWHRRTTWYLNRNLEAISMCEIQLRCRRERRFRLIAVRLILTKLELAPA